MRTWMTMTVAALTLVACSRDNEARPDPGTISDAVSEEGPSTDLPAEATPDAAGDLERPEVPLDALDDTGADAREDALADGEAGPADVPLGDDAPGDTPPVDDVLTGDSPGADTSSFDTPAVDTADADASGLDLQGVDTPGPDTPTGDGIAGDVPDTDIAGEVAAELPPADNGPEVVFAAERLAWAFVDNPLENGGEPTQVTLAHFTDPEGHLTGEFANVWNCLNVPGGHRVDIEYAGQNYWVNYCKLEKTVVPGQDGTYLHVRPPVDFSDPDDSFAEVQMYHGISRIHDYFRDVHGFAEADRSLFAAVNVQINLNDGPWQPLENAAYLPRGSGGPVGFDIGVDEELLEFGQGEVLDYSYETDVIHHEYSHSVVGGLRLMSFIADSQGLDPTPIGMNEGFADYFPASLAGDPVMGRWALGEQARDLSRMRRCPDHIVGETHFDGQILSSTLWDLREHLGAKVADDLAFQALMKSAPNTVQTEMAEFLIESADETYPELRGTVVEVLAAHGLDGCVRDRDWEDVDAGSPGLPLFLLGRQTSGLYEFRESVPAPVQLRVAVPEGATSVTVEVTAESESGPVEMGGEKIRLALALRAGDAPIGYTYFPKASNTSDVVLHPSVSRPTFTWVISGSCLAPGTLHLQFMNQSFGGAVIGARKVTVSTEPVTGTPTWDTCPAPVP